MTISSLNDKVAQRFIYILSVFVFLVVVILYNMPKAETLPGFVKYLPGLNAGINATCTLLLLVSYYNMKKGNILLHKNLNILTFCLSSLFLVSYITYHSFGIKTEFPSGNSLRPVYFFVLISHIILAAVVLPLVLLSFYRAFRGEIDKHKKLTKWSFPIWLYVTTTGVIVYFMISPYYKF